MKERFRLQHFKYPTNMDVECIPLCDVLNSCGLTTEHSCCGHGKSAFFIIFSNNISTAQIDEFLMLFTSKYNHTPFLGKFLMWSRKISGELVHTWMYEAPAVEFATEDMNTIIKELNLE